MISTKELLILTHLRKNARETLTRLSAKTGIPISTIHDKLKGRYAGVVEKYTALVNFTKLGFASRAYIILRVNKSQRSSVMEFLMRQEYVNSLYKINNGYDFLVDGLFKNIRDLEFFSERIDEKFDIKEMKIYHIIDDIKREDFLNTPESLRLLDLDEMIAPGKDDKAPQTSRIKQDVDDEQEPEEDHEQKRHRREKKSKE